jgi:hypothetical protein
MTVTGPESVAAAYQAALEALKARHAVVAVVTLTPEA